MGAFIDQTLATFELMTAAIVELRQRVEALERVNADRFAHWSIVHDAPHRPLDETDRSHDVVIGARVDSSHSGF